MKRRLSFGASAFLVALSLLPAARAEGSALFAGAAKENVTPFTLEPGVTQLQPGSDASASNPDGLPGPNPALGGSVERGWSRFEGTLTPTGVWGERYDDANGNGRYDFEEGETFTDDPGNTALDPDSAGKWDGTYLAGFGSDRVATGALDKLWARAAVFAEGDPGFSLLDQDPESFAIVSVDFLGYFSDWTDRIMEQAKSLWFATAQGSGPDFWLDRLILTHTHNHEGPDVHVGIWGPNPLVDGTYPLYERYVERKIALAIVNAMKVARPVKVRAGSLRAADGFTTKGGRAENLLGMQSRNSCRTPWFFDDELRALQAVDSENGVPVLTFINWGTHVESLGDGNTLLSSDFAGYARERLEERLGGVAMWLPGAQGAVEIVGDSCTSVWTRNTFDGVTYTTPDGEIDYGPARTRAIGALVGDAAYSALNGKAFDDSPDLEWVEPRDLYVPVTNEGLGALALKGVIDKPGYAGESVSADRAVYEAEGEQTGNRINRADHPFVPSPGTDARTTLYAFRIGPASFVTSPGELFPEIYYGVSTYGRTNASAYGSFSPSEDYLVCSAAAHNGRPPEPSIRDRQISRFGSAASVHFLLGYTPDLLGYIVPGYDYSIMGAPVVSGVGVPLGVSEDGLDVQQAPDDCADKPVVEGRQERYETHYHETNSASSMLGPAYACTIVDMLVPGIDSQSPACREWAEWKTAGVHNPAQHAAPPDGEDPFIRHY